jgi:hypothetical protein
MIKNDKQTADGGRCAPPDGSGCDCPAPTPVNDYVCEKCEYDVTICSECRTVLSSCACGHCSIGATFYESD